MNFRRQFRGPIEPRQLAVALHAQLAPGFVLTSWSAPRWHSRRSGHKLLRLAQVQYSPFRLAYQSSGDVSPEVAVLDRLTRDQPQLDAAPLVAGLLLTNVGRFDEALKRLELALATPRPTADLALARIDVLSRAGRHAEAVAAFDALPALTADPLEHAALALGCSVLRRARQPARAAEVAAALARCPSLPATVFSVDPLHARLVEARCLEEAGAVERSGELLGSLDLARNLRPGFSPRLP